MKAGWKAATQRVLRAWRLALPWHSQNHELQNHQRRHSEPMYFGQ